MFGIATIRATEQLFFHECESRKDPLQMKFLEVMAINPLISWLLVGCEVANLKNKELALSCQAMVGQYMQSERKRKESHHSYQATP